MKLTDFTALLTRYQDKTFQMLLPGGGEVPVAFHITEVGYVNKHFIDCGGQYHQSNTVQLQAWVGEDEDHRLETGKLLGILSKAAAGLFPPGAGEFPVEIEYENPALTQFRIKDGKLAGDSVVLELASKHTDCLAKDKCLPKPGAPAESSCCGGKC